jgi:hypothetical protein
MCLLLLRKCAALFTKENWMEMLILSVSYARSADQVCKEEEDDDAKINKEK